MNKAITLTGAVIVGLGVFVAIVIYLGKQRPSAVTATSSGSESAKATPPVAPPPSRSDIVSASISPSAPLLPADDPIQYDRQRVTDFNSEATKYTQAFQSGVELDDSVPSFVTLFERGGSRSTITMLFQQHKETPTDGWSATMEHRLGRYFEAQPEISTTKVLVSCRAPRCLLQLMELPQAERMASSAMTMHLRMKQEPWYTENFIDSSRFRPFRVSTQGDAVQYMGLILNRRPTIQ